MPIVNTCFFVVVDILLKLVKYYIEVRDVGANGIPAPAHLFDHLVQNSLEKHTVLAFERINSTREINFLTIVSVSRCLRSSVGIIRLTGLNPAWFWYVYCSTGANQQYFFSPIQS